MDKMDINKFNKYLVNESSSTMKIEKELKALIGNIKKGNNIDPRAFEEHTDGELLAMLLSAVFQGELLFLDDRKGFKKNFRF